MQKYYYISLRAKANNKLRTQIQYIILYSKLSETTFHQLFVVKKTKAFNAKFINVCTSIYNDMANNSITSLDRTATIPTFVSTQMSMNKTSTVYQFFLYISMYNNSMIFIFLCKIYHILTLCRVYFSIYAYVYTTFFLNKITEDLTTYKLLYTSI